MTKKMKIKRLKQQNDYLMKQNMKLRQKIPMEEYAKRIDQNLEKLGRINDDLVKLYKQLYRCILKSKRTTLRYRLEILMLKVRQLLRR